jgi:hypothetical protein
VLTGRGGPGVPRDGDRTVLSRHNFRRTYHAALAKLADPTGELRPTAARTLKALRAGGTTSVRSRHVRRGRHGNGLGNRHLEEADTALRAWCLA